MKWLQRLKTATCPEADATKATEPGFVGFVAPVPALMKKTAAPANAANDPAPTLKKPETAPWRVTLAPGTSAATAEKFRAASLALDQLIEDSNLAVADTDPDRSCWPHGDAMNTVEIDTFTARLARFTDKGMSLPDAEALADKLVMRNREGDDRRLCLECVHLSGFGPTSWRCGNWQAAGIAIRPHDTQLPAELVLQLQRCGGFTPHLIPTPQGNDDDHNCH